MSIRNQPTSFSTQNATTSSNCKSKQSHSVTRDTRVQPAEITPTKCIGIIMSHGSRGQYSKCLLGRLIFTSILAISLPAVLALSVPDANTSSLLTLPITDTSSSSSSNTTDDYDPSSIDSFLSSSNISSPTDHAVVCLTPAQAPLPYITGPDCDPIITHLIINLKRTGSLNPRLFLKAQKPPIPLDAIGVYKHWSYGSCSIILDSDYSNDQETFKMIQVIDTANKVVKGCVKGMQKAPLGGRMKDGERGFFVAVVNTENAAKEIKKAALNRGVPFSVGAG